MANNCVFVCTYSKAARLSPVTADGNELGSLAVITKAEIRF